MTGVQTCALPIWWEPPAGPRTRGEGSQGVLHPVAELPQHRIRNIRRCLGNKIHRTHSLADVWARHETVLALRGRTQLKGRCGVCEFRNVCGGCRAYPYQLTGDLMGEDDLCTVTAGIEEPVPC